MGWKRVRRLMDAIMTVVVDLVLMVNSTHGACFWRAAWTPRGNHAINFVLGLGLGLVSCSPPPGVPRGRRVEMTL